jgi:hypothetical protein
MGLFSWLFESSTEIIESDDITPSVNCDGTPMISGTTIDVEGKFYGHCEMDDSITSSCFDSSSDSFDSTMDSSFDDSFSSMNDDW